MRGRQSRKQKCAISFFLFCSSSYPPCYLSYKTQLRPPSWHCRTSPDIMAIVPALTYNLGPRSTVNCDARATFKHGDGKSPVTLSKWGPGTIIRRSAGGYTAQLLQAFSWHSWGFRASQSPGCHPVAHKGTIALASLPTVPLPKVTFSKNYQC